MLVKLWGDKEINGRIFAQVQHLFVAQFLSSEKEIFYKHVFSLMHKLSAIKYHLENYKRIEREQWSACRKKFKKNPNETEEAFELIFELESFHFQVKSSLDMMVKLMNPILGKNMVQTKTYKNEGRELIKGLTQYKKSWVLILGL